jgi:hypothetical protein
LALAIYLGYKDIELYGSDLSSNTEYHYQAVNYAFWIGFAHGHGVNLDMQCWRSEFYEQPIYGYEGELQLDNDFFEEVHREHEIVWKIKNNACKKLQSRLDDAILNNKFDKAADLSLTLETAMVNTAEQLWSMKEAERYAERTDHVSRQEFERVSAQAQLDGEDSKTSMDHSAGKCEYVWNIWKQHGVLEAKNQFRTFLKEKNEHAESVGKNLGIFRSNLMFMNEYDARVTAAGGQRAVAQTLGDKS